MWLAIPGLPLHFACRMKLEGLGTRLPLAYTSVFFNVHGTRINQVYRSDWPGHFVRIKDREGHIMIPQLSFVAPYKGIFIPVLRHGSIPCGVHKCEICRHHIEGTAGEEKDAHMPIAGMNDTNGSALSVRRTIQGWMWQHNLAITSVRSVLGWLQSNCNTSFWIYSWE